ncbi:MAG: IS66 family insertion sequence element accessory protein TnpA [Marinobacter sp.]|uniref:IS66 family insertion sequence element accessory protein TnpA n=1 Tax=Marinobacter sp. TaxID=50741 RepID=UPI003F9D8D8E
MSGNAFCKQQSLIYRQFVYWRLKIIQNKCRQPPYNPSVFGDNLDDRLATTILVGWA